MNPKLILISGELTASNVIFLSHGGKVAGMMNIACGFALLRHVKRLAASSGTDESFLNASNELPSSYTTGIRAAMTVLGRPGFWRSFEYCANRAEPLLGILTEVLKSRAHLFRRPTLSVDNFIFFIVFQKLVSLI